MIKMKLECAIITLATMIMSTLSTTGYCSEVIGTPAPVCYTKQQKCCYTYELCGHVPKQVVKKEECSYTKCMKECKDECGPVIQCDLNETKVGSCDSEDDGDKYGEVGKCVMKRRKRCKTEEKCGFKCRRKCKQVEAYCTRNYYYEYGKYCAVHRCENLVVSEGNDTKPHFVVLKEYGVLEKMENGTRIDL